MDRKSEKMGWTIGWLGSFVWVLILAVSALFQDKVAQGIAGLGITLIAISLVVFFAPWRHPIVQYRWLMAPIYVLFAISVLWAYWAVGSFYDLGFSNSWSLFVLLPVLIPFWTIGNRKWSDGEAIR